MPNLEKHRLIKATSCIANKDFELKVKAVNTPYNYIYEDQVGCDDSVLHFVCLSTCVGVACVYKDCITGGHFTFSTEPYQLDVMLQAWVNRLNAKKAPSTMYMFGPVTKWGTYKIAKGLAEMVKLFKTELDYSGKVYCYDQAPLVEATYRFTHVGGGGTTAIAEVADHTKLKFQSNEIADATPSAFKVIPATDFETK